MSSPSIPKGTRDFTPIEMARRNFIFDTIRSIFKLHGYLPIETPAMENLSTLMGKYGEEGDKLLFKILDSGDYLNSIEVNTRGIKSIELKKILNVDVNILEGVISFIKDEVYKNIGVDDIINKFNKNYSDSSIIFFGEFIFFKKKKRKRNQEELYQYISNLTTNRLIDNVKLSIKLSSLGIFSKSHRLTNHISEKGLRYDLTVPFARFVVQHNHEITFPFKRYQIQPVWRADRPQKGRYREFYQCDVDVIGSNSLLYEVEMVTIAAEIFNKLGISITILMNNRKILSGIAEVIGESARITDITVAIDKLDKIGQEGVNKELTEKGLSAATIEKLQPILSLKGSSTEKLDQLSVILATSETGLKGIEEMRSIFNFIEVLKPAAKVEIDLTLARGLNYYTGAIIEIKANNVQMGSISGGGRYDDLTGIFGLKGMSGIGISFGADRIYDVMNELKLFPPDTEQATKVLLVNFGGNEELVSLKFLEKLHAAGISAEIYPEAAKMKKQFSYADNKKIPYTIIIGADEASSGIYQMKNMITGEQEKITAGEIVRKLE